MAGQGVIGIALNIDYQKALQQMTNDFNRALTQISNESKKNSYAADMKTQIEAVKSEVKGLSDEFRSEFQKINSQQINSDNFNEFKTKVTKDFDDIEKKFASVNTKIYNLRKQLGLLDGSDFATGMKKQFDDISQSVLNTYKGLEEIVGLTKVSNKSPVVKLDESTIGEYKKTLGMINKLYSEASKTPTGNWGQMGKELKVQEDLLREQIALYDKRKAKLSSMDPSASGYKELENELVRIQIKANEAAVKIQNIFKIANSKGFKPALGDGTEALITRADSFIDEISGFENKVRGMIQANKEAQDSLKQTQETFSTFQIKDGAVHIPVDIATKSEDLKNRIQGIVQELKTYADKNPVIAKVKLTLDGGSSKGYKTNADVAKQLEDGQGEPAVDISKAIKRTYTQAVREAERTAKDSIKAIQAIFDGSPVKITPNKEAFTSELSNMVNSSLGKIAKDSMGLSVNGELEKLIANLREVSTTLSGNGNFKFGLDEGSIERITAAIQNMADMIQRAFGVASNSDISAQWSTIEGKFKSVAKENGVIDARFSKNKEAMRELAVEYKKYLDMGGSKKLSELTNDTNTVKKLTGYYQELGRAANEADQKQEQSKKKSSSTKVSSEEKEAVKGVTAQNKNLEDQAVKTGTALDNEGKKAQSASEKFRKLAKEKGAAVVANRELAKAAKETADALEKEARIRKETGTKTGKGAVDSGAYATNALAWKKGIEQSLLSSGTYEEVYGSQIKQAANGVVTFKAYVKELKGEWQALTATVDSFGNITSPKIQAASEKQVLSIERAKSAWEKYVNAMASEGVEPNSFNRSELEEYIQTILKAEESLDKFKIKKVELGNTGKLAITSEFKDADGRVKTFIANFSSIDDIIDETTGSVKNLAQALESAFASSKLAVSKGGDQSSVLSRYEEIYTIAQKLGNLDLKIAGLDATKNSNQIEVLTAQYRELEGVYTRLVGEFFKDADVGKLPMDSIQELNGIFEAVKKQIDEIDSKLKDSQTNFAKGFGIKAQEAFSKFELKYQGNSNWSQVADDMDRLKRSIAGIDSQDKLNEFKQNLSDIAVKLNNMGKDNKLGTVLNSGTAFKDINQVRANIDSLFASIGKVDGKSIRVSGIDKLVANVKTTNGEIHKMSVSLDSNGFARFVDNGIVQFGRLKTAVEGVFNGIFGYFRYYLSPYMLVSYTRRAIEKIKEVDAAMTELKKVSDASAGEISAYFDDAVVSAKKLGSSVNEMIRATADWQRMGME